MSKRRSDIQLNRDNFDDDIEEVQVVGETKKPSVDVLKDRVFVKAKRRLPQESSTADNTSAFVGFKGFGSMNTNLNTFEKFNFGSTTTTLFGANNALSTKPTNNITTTIVPNIGDTSDNEKKSNTKETSDKTNSTISCSDDIFAANLTKLNQTFFDHIKTYIDKSMVYDFTIVCEEYISQYKKLKENNQESTNETNVSTNTVEKQPNALPKSETTGLFKIAPFPSTLPNQKSSFFNNIPSTNFSFGTNKVPIETSTFSSQGQNADPEGGGDDEQPPKVDSVQHNEEDAVFTQKCKLYYKKDSSFVEKGLAFLYIKVKDDQSKPQLLIRADTTTGNILLNIALVESLPVLKAEKGKGVLITCVPNPPIETKKQSNSSDSDRNTETFLIRVKQSDSEHLYNKLIEYKTSKTS